MGKSVFGYGFEWQLLRMLGRHLQYFINQIKEQTGIEISRWFDFKFKKSKDTELTQEDLKCFANIESIDLNVLPDAL